MDLNSTIDKLTPVFQAVAEKIGQGAGFGWEVILKQQVVYGIGLLCGAGLALLAIIALTGCIYIRTMEKLDDDNGFTGWDLDFLGFLVVVYVVLGLALFGLALGGFFRMINPEYYALQFFMQLGT